METLRKVCKEILGRPKKRKLLRIFKGYDIRDEDIKNTDVFVEKLLLASREDFINYIKEIKSLPVEERNVIITLFEKSKRSYTLMSRILREFPLTKAESKHVFG